jgi:hypothetical protein
MPVRGNEWYYHDMICYCLDMDINKLENILYVIKSSLLLPKRYYNKFIDYCYKNIENCSKLAINSMIGNFKPDFSKSFSESSCDAFTTFVNHQCCLLM